MKRTKLSLIVGLSAFFVLSGLSSQQALAGSSGDKKLKKRLAVFTFADKTDHSWRWWGSKSVGEGMADMLITELVKSGDYIVIERTELDQLLQEQNLARAGIVTPESAAQAGKVLGVELAVIGSVTEFGRAKGGVGGSLKGISLGVKSNSATVAVDVRIVNTTTGEILAAESVRKSKSKKGLSFRKGRTSFNNQNQFDNSIIGKATRDAIKDVVKLIGKHSPAVRWQAKVVKGDANSVIINAGAAVGVDVGERFLVVKPGEALIDPDTGLSLGSEEEVIGEIEVVSNSIGNGKASRCKVISGSGFTRGQIVREK